MSLEGQGRPWPTGGTAGLPPVPEIPRAPALSLRADIAGVAVVGKGACRLDNRIEKWQFSPHD